MSANENVRLGWSSDFEEAGDIRGFVGRPIDRLREIVRNVTIGYESWPEEKRNGLPHTYSPPLATVRF